MHRLRVVQSEIRVSGLNGGVNLLLMKVVDYVDRDWFLEVRQFVQHGAAS